MENTSTESNPEKRETAPNIFRYMDYRAFLGDSYRHLKKVKPAFSYASFARIAGLQTPNYLKRVVDGERPVTPENLPKFCLALKLEPKESLYFEALVNYNQSKDEKVKVHYLGLLKQVSKGQRDAAVEIFSHQYEIFSNWFLMPIREMVLLKDFRESPEYIAKKMKNKITPRQAKAALEILMKVGLLVRNKASGRLEQASPQLEYSKDVVNLSVRKFHTEMLQRTETALSEDEWSSWNVRALSIAVKTEDIPRIHKEMDAFIAEINRKYTNTDPQCGSVVQFNSQIIELTEKET